MRPTWGELRQFCAAQGYRESRTDHFHYVKVVGDRETSGTMVSFGIDGETIPPQFWVKVWKRQLKLLSEEEFWKGLSGEAVKYDIPPGPEPITPLPAYLERFLRSELHWTDEQVAGVTRAAAQELLNAHYARELRDPEAN
jgi:hypothetical protein